MDIEEDIKFYHSTYMSVSFPKHIQTSVLELENICSHYFRLEQERWRLKSRSIQLEKGVQKTNIFHQFENYRNGTQNAIWDIKGHNGNMVHEPHDIEAEVVGHFHQIFSSQG